jgi:hypothetical protein
MTLEWVPNASNTINFVMVNASNTEVTGLGAAGLTVQIRKPGASTFATTTGSKNEVGSGWYWLVAEPSEADTRGEIAIKVTGSGAVQQNLAYMIGNPQEGFGATAHTINVVVDGNPVDGAEVWLTTDIAGAQPHAGPLTTNAQGNVTFYLDSGTYYVWIQHGSHTFTNPTTITI